MSEQITQAFHAINETEQLALKTGVQDHRNNEAWGAGLTGENAGNDGVAYAEAIYPFDSRRHEVVEGLVTDDAAIAADTRLAKNWKRTHQSFRYAKTHEITGTYTAYPTEDGEPAPTLVRRPDGNGGVYKATLQGENAERATAIIGNRAAKRVRRAVVDRVVKIADELKHEEA